MTASTALPTLAIALQADIPDWLAWTTSIATVIIALALVVTAVALAAVAVSAGKLFGKLHRLADRLHDDVRPALRHVQDATENVNFITSSVRQDVEQFKGTLRSSQARLERAAASAERRIDDFNALLGVVQEEAESLFIDTASTLRGVRAGADALQGGVRAEQWDEEDEAEDLLPPRRQP